MAIGEAHRTVRFSSPLLIFSSIIGAPNGPPALSIQNFCPFCVFGAPLVMAQGALVRQYWRRVHRYAPILLARGASVRQHYWRRVHRCTISISDRYTKNHLRTIASLLTPFIFHYPLPLSLKDLRKIPNSQAFLGSLIYVH